MANIPSGNQDQRPNRIGTKVKDSPNTLDAKSLNDYFNKMQEFEKLLNKTRSDDENRRLQNIYQRKKELDKKRADAEESYETNLIEELEDFRLALGKDRLSVLDSEEADYAKMHSKDKEKKALELVKKVHEQELEYYKDLTQNKEKEAKKEADRLKKNIEAYKKINQAKNSTAKDAWKLLGGDAKGNITKLLTNVKANFKAIPKNLISSAKSAPEVIGKNLATDTMMNAQIFKEGFSKMTENLSTNISTALTSLGNQINNLMGDYANLKGSIDARLQGSTKSFNSSIDALKNVSYSGLLSTKELYTNLEKLVKEGIVNNVEQKALLMTMSDNIAGTFEVNSKTLKQIIRVQQQDSTAARLGMESYLTKFLNSFVESTEYLTDTFDGVADSLLTASSLMSTAAESTEFEYTVQKWLGSLSGVGFSSEASSSIAQALGYLGSGNISQLSSSNMQNLLVMAANKSGLSYGDLLTNGLDSNSTNQLMYGIVEYLQEIGQSQNNVIKSQLADVFGVTITDLKAVNNLTIKDLNTLREENLTYSGMYEELNDQFKTLGSRIGTAKILDNSFNNFQYGTAMNMASNPALYAMWKITDMIQSVTNGIAIPTISVMGNMVDLNTTVENLMKTGLIGVSTLGSIGSIINGVGSNFDGSTLLKAVNINSNNTLMSRGSNSIKNSKRLSGVTTSASTYVGNADSTAYSESTVGAARDEGNRTLNSKKQEEQDNDPVVKYLAESVGLEAKMSAIISAINTINKDGVAVSNVDAFKTIMPASTILGSIEGIR